jgi:hypothetical protein
VPEPYARPSTAGANGLGVGPEIFKVGLMVSVAVPLVEEPAGVEVLAISEAVMLIVAKPEPLRPDPFRHEYEPDKLPLDLNEHVKPLGKPLSVGVVE